MMKRIIDFVKAVLIISRHGSDVIFRDSLTSLYNRRFFHEIAKKEIERVKRHKHPLSLVFLDVDALKQINDTLGHKAGDNTLKKVAQALIRNCRKSDIPARWGGDEFLLFLPETNEEDAKRLIQRIVKELGKTHLSYGITSWQDDNSSLEDFIAQVDQKMYKSKKAKLST